jgi:hypothetical protein
VNLRKLALFALAGFVLPFVQFQPKTDQNTLGPNRFLTSKTIELPAHGISALDRALRPNFPYSVIPGGVYSVAELRQRQASDSAVRDHYTDFAMDRARLVTLRDDQMAYVSYRRQGQILWTTRKLRIPKGEMLLTDGRNYARTRCGNRLSSIPMQPGSGNGAGEPTKELSLPLNWAPLWRAGLIPLTDVPVGPGSPPVNTFSFDTPPDLAGTSPGPTLTAFLPPPPDYPATPQAGMLFMGGPMFRAGLYALGTLPVATPPTLGHPEPTPAVPSGPELSAQFSLTPEPPTAFLLAGAFLAVAFVVKYNRISTLQPAPSDEIE